jgi:hypothetical protein
MPDRRRRYRVSTTAHAANWSHTAHATMNRAAEIDAAPN